MAKEKTEQKKKQVFRDLVVICRKKSFSRGSMVCGTRQQRFRRTKAAVDTRKKNPLGGTSEPGMLARTRGAFQST